MIIQSAAALPLPMMGGGSAEISWPNRYLPTRWASEAGQGCPKGAAGGGRRALMRLGFSAFADAINQPDQATGSKRAQQQSVALWQ